jgi:hypothetical protein
MAIIHYIKKENGLALNWKLTSLQTLVARSTMYSLPCQFLTGKRS